MSRLHSGSSGSLPILQLPEFISISHKTRNPLFDGTNRSVTFVCTTLGPNKRPGREIVRIAETTSEQGTLLVRTRAAFEPGADQHNWPLSIWLFYLAITSPNVVFLCGGRSQLAERPAQQAQLPSAVKLRMRDATTQRILSVSTATLTTPKSPWIVLRPSLTPNVSGFQLRPTAAAGKSPT